MRSDDDARVVEGPVRINQFGAHHADVGLGEPRRHFLQPTALQGVHIVVEVQHQRRVEVGPGQIDQMGVIERRTAIGRPDHRASEIRSQLDSRQISDDVGVARVIVDDHQLRMAPVHGLIEPFNAFLQQVQPVAGGDDNRHRQARQVLPRPTKLVKTPAPLVGGLGQKGLGAPAAALGGVCEGPPRLFNDRIRSGGFPRNGSPGMMADERQVRHLLRPEAITQPQQQIEPRHAGKICAERTEGENPDLRHEAELAGEQSRVGQGRAPVGLELRGRARPGVIHPVFVGVDQFQRGMRGEALGNFNQGIRRQSRVAGDEAEAGAHGPRHDRIQPADKIIRPDAGLGVQTVISPG